MEPSYPRDAPPERLDLPRPDADLGAAPDPAAYQTERPDIPDDVDRIAQSAQTRIRSRLQPLLTSAGLYRAEGDAKKARDLYSQILTRSPDWPAAPHDSLVFLIEQGDLAVIRGSLPDAKQDYAEAHTRAKRLLEVERDEEFREFKRDVVMPMIPCAGSC